MQKIIAVSIFQNSVCAVFCRLDEERKILGVVKTEEWFSVKNSFSPAKLQKYLDLYQDSIILLEGMELELSHPYLEWISLTDTGWQAGRRNFDVAFELFLKLQIIQQIIFQPEIASLFFINDSEYEKKIEKNQEVFLFRHNPHPAVFSLLLAIGWIQYPALSKNWIERYADQPAPEDEFPEYLRTFLAITIKADQKKSEQYQQLYWGD